MEFFTFHSVNRAPHVVASIRKEDNKKGGLIHRTDFLMHKNKTTSTMERGVDPCHNLKELLRVHNHGGEGDVDALPGKSAHQITSCLKKEQKREWKGNP